jgi:HlyD family secretion protein
MHIPLSVLRRPFHTVTILIVLGVGLTACGTDSETASPVRRDITESVYASGLIKSKGQYQVYSTVSGIVDSLFVTEGDDVEIGAAVLSISSTTQQLNRDNARLAAEFDAADANSGRLDEARQATDVARSRLTNDSLLFVRQQRLWQQGIGSKVEAEQRELVFQNSRLSYLSAKERYDNLKRQISLSDSRSRNNLRIADKQQGDFTVRSLIKGRVYSLTVQNGELVSPQMPLAIIGDAQKFVLEMQVDERDINRIVLGMRVVVTLNSEKNKVYEAAITKINPLMNTQSKSFAVEAEFSTQPETLFPNVTFEANIVVQTKKNVLIVPREYLVDETYVLLKDGDKVKVQTGLMDFNNVEILSGISVSVQLIKPMK